MDKSKNSRYNNLSKSCSLPLFSINGNAGRLPSCLTVDEFNKQNNLINPTVIKMQMMEDRIKNLERKKQDQNYQLNTLMEYQLNQNRYPKSNSALLLPVIKPQPQPNILLITSENNNIQPLNYQNSIHPYYNKKKHNSHQYQYKKTKNENLVRDLIKSQKIDKIINENLISKIYLPIKDDINKYKKKINYNIRRKIELNNNIVNHNIKAAQNNSDEIKYLFQNKIDKIELKQKLFFENLKNQLKNSVNNIQKEGKDNKNRLYELKILEFENKRKMEERQKLLQSEINENIKNAMRKDRELEEMKHQRELDEIRKRYEIEDIENKKIIEELKFHRMKENLRMKNLKNNNLQPQPQIFQHPFQYSMMQFSMPFINNKNQGNNKNIIDDLFKLLMMKQLLDDDLFSEKKQTVKIKRYYDHPPKSYSHSTNINMKVYKNKNIKSKNNISSQELCIKSYKTDKKRKTSDKLQKTESKKSDKKKKDLKKLQKEENVKNDTKIIDKDSSKQIKKDKMKKKKIKDSEDYEYKKNKNEKKKKRINKKTQKASNDDKEDDKIKKEEEDKDEDREDESNEEDDEEDEEEGEEEEGEEEEKGEKEEGGEDNEEDDDEEEEEDEDEDKEER